MQLDQQRRYARQIMLSEIGEAGQQQLLTSRVLVIGAGGLGSALISYLAAAGVGTIGVIDPDRVELSNLARQIIHETGDIGRLKVESASDRIAELNPDVKIIPYPFAITAANAESIIGGTNPQSPIPNPAYDIIADGCDNFASRFAVNAACVKLGKLLVSAAIAGWDGQVMTVMPGSPCYQCLVNPEAPEANTCRESGVIGPLAGIIGSMQAQEVINTLLGKPALAGNLLRFDARTMAQRISRLTQDAHCPVCGA